MDCDLQDQPEEIPRLLAYTQQERLDFVMAKRANRQDGYFKRLFSKLFYQLLGYLTDTAQDHETANFGIYHRKVIEAVLSMDDYLWYFPVMIKWVGFRGGAMPVVHAPRAVGKSSYSLGKLLRLATNVILSFSDKPLRLVIKTGVFISALTLVASVYYLVQYSRGYITVSGWTSLILSIWFLSGLMISVMGMTGLYVGKIFDQVKQRPIFIIDQIPE